MRVDPTLSQLFNIVPSLMMQENAFDDGASLQDMKQFDQEQNRRADIISSEDGEIFKIAFPLSFDQLIWNKAYMYNSSSLIQC